MTIPKVTAHFHTILGNDLQASTGPGGTFNLANPNDENGVPLTGRYGFTVDVGTGIIETILGDIAAGVVTIILRGVDPNAPNMSDPSLINSHQRGASVIISDYSVIGVLYRILAGIDTLDNIISYTAHQNFSAPFQLIDKEYVDGAVIASGVPATTTNPGIGFVATDSDVENSVDTTLYVPTGLLYPNFLVPSQVSNIGLRSYPAAHDINLLDAVYIKSYTPGGGVAFDAYNSIISESGTPPSPTLTIGINANRCLIVNIVTFYPNTVSAVTFGGQTMTLVASKIDGNPGLSTYCYYLNAPPSGNGTLLITGSNGSYWVAMNSYSNVSQSGQPEASVAHSSQSGGPVLIDTVTDDATVFTCAFAWSSGGSSSPAASGTPNTDANQIAGENGCIYTADTGELGVAPVPITPSIGFTGLLNSVFESLISVSLATASSSGAEFAVDQVDTSANASSDTFIGFATAATLQDADCPVITTGYVDGFTGLTPAIYYGQDAPNEGTIGTTPGTKTRIVGIGVSPTTLLITNVTP